MTSFDFLSKNFMALESNFDEASVVVFGAPFDSTCSFRPGTRFASQAMRKDFIGLELYSPYLDRELSECSICDYGDLDLPFGDPETSLRQIQAFSEKVLAARKIPFMIGGEHGLSLGCFRAAQRFFPDLEIIQLDAHTDLREDYLGLKLSHASVLRRAHDLLGDGRLHQYGIRSGEKEEFIWAEKHSDLHKFNLDGLDRLAEKLRARQTPVYLTLDLDILDPSVFPGTGTPEPGGLSFEELRRGLCALEGLNLVGLDIMELSPPYDPSGISVAVACKIFREMLLLFAPRSKKG